jgi:hypothetical protein
MECGSLLPQIAAQASVLPRQARTPKKSLFSTKCSAKFTLPNPVDPNAVALVLSIFRSINKIYTILIDKMGRVCYTDLAKKGAQCEFRFLMTVKFVLLIKLVKFD